MKASKLIIRLKIEIEKYGDYEVTTFDLDRDLCEINEVEFSDYPYKNIYIG